MVHLSKIRKMTAVLVQYFEKTGIALPPLALAVSDELRNGRPAGQEAE